jgi:hypothetical protein
VVAILATGFVLSFGLSVYGVSRHPDAAFYLLPTRAWELLVGSLLAFLPPRAAPSGRRVLREAAGLAGLALILAPVLLYTRATPFPGPAALPPCLGAALVIWATGEDRSVPTAVARVLSIRPLVFVGLISYSLYLWHWPALAFARYLALLPLSAGRRASLAALGLVLAVLSWKYVETPFRTRRLGASRKAMYAFAGAGLAIVLVCGLTFRIEQGFPGRVPTEAVTLAEAATDRAFINELTGSDVRAEKLVSIGVNDPAASPVVLVWGDSHAMAVLPAVDAFLKERGASGRAATHSCMAPVIGWFEPGKCGLGDRSTDYNAAVFAYIQSHRIPEVILSARWGGYRGEQGENAEAMESALLETVRQLVAIGARPWVLLDVPNHPFDVPRALSRAVTSRVDIVSLSARPSPSIELDDLDPKTVAAIEAAGGRILNPKSRFLDATGEYYVVKAGSVVLYRDHHHLTTKGAELMLVPLLRDSGMLGVR